MIEYMPFVLPLTAVVRCLRCGALVGSGDTPEHTAWHEKIGG